MGALLGRPHCVQAGPGDRRAVPIGGGGVLTGSGDAHGSENRHEHLLGRRHVVVGRGPGSLGSTIALVLDDSAGLAPVETSVGSTWVRAIGVGAGVGGEHERELPSTGAVLGAGSPRCSHPCVLGLPPGPQLTLDGVPVCSVVEAAVDVALLGRYYERIADHAASMARRIIYIVTGDFPEDAYWPQP